MCAPITILFFLAKTPTYMFPVRVRGPLRAGRVDNSPITRVSDRFFDVKFSRSPILFYGQSDFQTRIRVPVRDFAISNYFYDPRRGSLVVENFRDFRASRVPCPVSGRRRSIFNRGGFARSVRVFSTSSSPLFR